VILSFFVWLEFLIYYIISAPVSALCNSIPTIQNDEYQAPVINISVNFQRILTSCMQNENLFHIKLNAKGDTMFTTGLAIISSKLDFAKYLTGSTFDSFIQFPNPSSKTSQLTSLNLSSYNFNGLSVPAVFGFNLSSIILQLNNTKNNITTETINSNLGSRRIAQMKIDNFNTMALTFNSSWINWTYVFIDNVYIRPGRQFVGTDVTNNPSDTINNARMMTAFYPEVFSRTYFISKCQDQLDLLFANITSTISTLQDMENNQIQPMTSILIGMNNTIPFLKNQVTVIQSILDSVTKTIIPLFDSSISHLKDWIKLQVNDVIGDAIPYLVQSLIDRNPSQDFGQCTKVAEDITYTEKSVCILFLNSISAQWFAFCSIGLLMIILFVLSMKTKKRIEYWEELNKKKKEYAPKDIESQDNWETKGSTISIGNRVGEIRKSAFL
jgi:hypothetical protein